MLVFKVCGARQNFYVFSLYRNPDQAGLDDRIYDSLLTTMAAVKAADANKQTANNNDLLEKRWRYKELHIQGLIVWHSRSRQCVLTAINTLHYYKLD